MRQLRLDSGCELFPVFGERPEIAPGLNAAPEGVGLAEERPEADGYGRGDGAFTARTLSSVLRTDPRGSGRWAGLRFRSF